MVSTEEKEVWLRGYTASITGRHYSNTGGTRSAANEIANNLLEDFKKKFETPGNYREPDKQ